MRCTRSPAAARAILFSFFPPSPQWPAYKKAAEQRWHEGDLMPYYDVWCGRSAGTLLYLWTAGTNGWHALFCDWGTSAVMRFIKRSCLAFIKPYHPTMWLDANAKFKFHPLTLVEGSGSQTTETVRKFEGGKQFCQMETCRTCNLTFESRLFFFFLNCCAQRAKSSLFCDKKHSEHFYFTFF